MSRTPRLTVEPSDALVDDPVVISAVNLTPLSHITAHARLESDGCRLAAWGHFTTTADGELDVSRHPSISGTYTGVDAMGLFWSMRPDPGQRKGLRLTKRDVTSPYDVTISLLEGHLDMSSATSPPDNHLCQVHVFRWYKAKDVRRKEVRSGKVRGVLFVPPGPGPHPGVIDMFGTAGGLLEYKASLLASRGFATLALPYFNYKDLPRMVEDVDFNYFLEAVDWFIAQPEVSPRGIGLMGVSKGSDFALLLAMHRPEVKAVASIGGTPFVMFCDLKFGNTFFPGVRLNYSIFVETEDGIIATGSLQPEDHHLFDYSKIKVPVLMLAGDQDGTLVPGVHEQALAKLTPEERSNFRSILYKRTGHLLEPPYAPVFTSTFHKEFGRFVNWGGQLPDHALAQEHAWKTILNFFRTNLPRNVRNYRTGAKL